MPNQKYTPEYGVDRSVTSYGGVIHKPFVDDTALENPINSRFRESGVLRIDEQ